MKKALFIVPHEDDELFIGGGTIVRLVNDPSFEVFVLIATNGDYYPYEGPIRMRESLNGLKTLGVDSDHVIFLGYGDGWQNGHIYDDRESERCWISHGGHSETYSLPEKMEWCFEKNAAHHAYTRQNYLYDIKDVLNSLEPDAVFCVDLDAHHDHQCLSLLTEEAIGMILKEKRHYHPLVLKKFAYENVMVGKHDYFTGTGETVNLQGDRTQNPFFSWGERISVPVPENCYTAVIEQNILYKSARCYKTQKICHMAPGYLNSDMVYWQRRTDNLLAHAEITASSGDPSYLNDFKLFDSTDLLKGQFHLDDGCWFPDRLDQEPAITIRLEEPCSAEQLIIYLKHSAGLKNIEISIDNMKTQILKPSAQEWDKVALQLPREEIQNILVSFEINDGSCFGVSEIELLSEDPNQSILNELTEGSKPVWENGVLSRLDAMVFAAKRKAAVHTKNRYEKKRQVFDKEGH